MDGSLPEVLRRLRSGKYTQEEIAERIGVSQVLVSDWERGRIRPNPVHLRALLDLYVLSDAERLHIYEMRGEAA